MGLNSELLLPMTSRATVLCCTTPGGAVHTELFENHVALNSYATNAPPGAVQRTLGAPHKRLLWARKPQLALGFRAILQMHPQGFVLLGIVQGQQVEWGEGLSLLVLITEGQYLILYRATCPWVLWSSHCLFIRTSCLPVPPQTKHTQAYDSDLVSTWKHRNRFG